MQHDKTKIADGESMSSGSNAGPAGQKFAIPDRGGLAHIGAAALNSIRGLKEGLTTEAAIKQEFALLLFGLPISFFVASSVWIWLALIASLFFILTTEFLNTAIERLCNHVTPELHEEIGVTKDLASAGVLFSLVLAGLVWAVALVERFDLLG